MVHSSDSAAVVALYVRLNRQCETLLSALCALSAQLRRKVASISMSRKLPTVAPVSSLKFGMKRTDRVSDFQSLTLLKHFPF